MSSGDVDPTGMADILESIRDYAASAKVCFFQIYTIHQYTEEI